MAQTSNDMVTVEITPEACVSSAVTWVSTPTSIGLSARGPVATVRRRCERDEAPLTSSAGPKKVTRLLR